MDTQGFLLIFGHRADGRALSFRHRIADQPPAGIPGTDQIRAWSQLTGFPRYPLGPRDIDLDE